MMSRGNGACVSKIIRHVVGLPNLRPGQLAVIDAVPAAALRSATHSKPEDNR
jgi:hypothetical protein